VGKITKIEWTDSTWNPVTGCTKISEGCKNCYAERLIKRFHPDRDFNEIRYYRDRDAPVHWKKPRKVFVCSMSDLFHKDIDDYMITQTFLIMDTLAPQHTYFVLTKRPQRMFEYIQMCIDYKVPMPKNVWLGVSVENQARADERIPILLKTRAIKHFVSVEPMLGKIDLSQYLLWNVEHPAHRLDWVICGCESGPGARPFDPAWAEDLRDQCEFARVPFFYKQGLVNGSFQKMPMIDGQVYDQFPE
jgi:protein gp37